MVIVSFGCILAVIGYVVVGQYLHAIGTMVYLFIALICIGRFVAPSEIKNSPVTFKTFDANMPKPKQNASQTRFGRPQVIITHVADEKPRATMGDFFQE